MAIKKDLTYPSSIRALLAQVLLAVTVIAGPALAQTPVGHWKFDDGSGTQAVDSSSSGHPAILVNGAAWVTGKAGGAVAANAAKNQYVRIPAIDLSGAKAVTVALWANRTYSTAGRHTLFATIGNSTTDFALLPDDNTCAGIQAVLRGNLGYVANCYSQPSSGVWHHLAVVFDKTQTGGDEVRFYVDGVLQTPNRSLYASTNTNNFGDNPLYLFSRAGAAEFNSGMIGDLRIYDSALTAEQIRQIYNSAPQTSASSAYNDTGLMIGTPDNHRAQATGAAGALSSYSKVLSGKTLRGGGGANDSSGRPKSISYVQGNYAAPRTPQTTVNVTFNAAQSAGDLNVVAVGWKDSTAVVAAVTDQSGNSYTRAVGPTVQSGIASQSIYYARNIVPAAAGANTVTVTFSTAAKLPDIRALEYRGADPDNPVDVTAANSGDSTTSSSGPATTTNATDLIFGANLGRSLTRGPGIGFTKRLLTSPDGDIAEDRMVAATGSYSATAPIWPTGRWIMQMVAFRAAASGSFTLSVFPASLSIAQGNQGTSTITTAVSAGFNSPILLSASGMPTGTTVSFNPQTIPAPGSGTSAMTITVGGNTPSGIYPITVTGNGGGTQQTATVTLTVTAAPNFTLSSSPASLSVVQGNQGTSIVTATISGGFNSAISLSASGLPTGTTVSFTQQTIPAPGSGNSTMTITVGASTPVGTYPITVTGNGGGIQQSTSVNLTVTAQVALGWSASSSPGIAGYNAYRSTMSGGPYSKLNSTLIPNTSYGDQNVQSGDTYYYVTTAVDSQGRESAYSNEAAATVP